MCGARVRGSLFVMQREVLSETHGCSQGTFTCSCYGNADEGTEESDSLGTAGQPRKAEEGSVSEAEERSPPPKKRGQKHPSLPLRGCLHFIPPEELFSLELTPPAHSLAHSHSALVENPDSFVHFLPAACLPCVL